MAQYRVGCVSRGAIPQASRWRPSRYWCGLAWLCYRPVRPRPTRSRSAAGVIGALGLSLSAPFRSRRALLSYGSAVRRFDGVLLAGLPVMILLLAAACGTQHASSSAPVTSSSVTAESPKPTENYCPQVPGVAAPSGCVSAGAEQNQQANQTFNSRIPLPASVAAQAALVTRRIRESLERLAPAQRLRVSAVRSALLAGGLHPAELGGFGGAPTSSVAFGGYELLSTSPPVCAWGSVSVKSIEVDSGGITREGGCLESAGGH